VTELSATQTGLLLAAIGVIAFLYSSVGHGGATGYLAVMALLGVAPALAKPGALWINCCAASIAFWRFRSAGFFDRKIFAPLAVASVPLAWLGSKMHLEGRAYSIVLGATLLGAGWLLGWGRRNQTERGIHSASSSNTANTRNEFRAPASLNLPMALVIGGVLGLLAGMTGIGGGVFLTPLLIFLRWTPAKTASGISALFIVVNSVAGLIGLGDKALIWQPAYVVAPAIAVVAALVGTHFSVKRWSLTVFRRVLAVVLWIAAVKLLLTGK
jgi:uncharacterized membrane protein YfcA